MNNTDQHWTPSQLSRKITVQCVLTVVIYLLTLFGGYFLAYMICELFTWSSDDPLYYFLNAINYSYPKSEIQLVLKRSETEVLIFVKNRGKTIPPEKLKRIFEQFFRLDSSRATNTGGAGLGLAIAKEIVELHGGTIHADSSAESVLFAVTLPLESQKNL